MSEYSTPPLIDEASIAQLPANFFDDLMPLLEEFGPALAMTEESWRIVDQTKQEIYDQAAGRKLHPRDTLLLQATEENCAKICRESIDPLIASGDVADKATRVSVTARHLVSLITSKEPRKQKGPTPAGIDPQALSKLQASRIVGLGLQQVVYDELQAITEIEELSQPLAVCLAQMLQRKEPPLNTCEAELLRIASTVHKQNPRQNFITDLYRNIASADELTNREDFLYESLLYNNSQHVMPPKLKGIIDIMRLHVTLFTDTIEDRDMLSGQQIQEAALEAYVNWFKEQQPWSPDLKEGLADYTVAKQQSLIQGLDAGFTKYYIAGREFYRTTPLSGVSN